MRLPSGDHKIPLTRSLCPRCVLMRRPLATSHICTTFSSPFDAMRLLSGDHAMTCTQPPWLRKLESFCPLMACQMCTSFKEPEARYLPSGDHATARTQ